MPKSSQKRGPLKNAVKEKASGIRSVMRAIRVLKTITARKEIGWRLTDLATHCDLDVSTTYRMLSSLASEGMVQQRKYDRRYVPGPLLFELALSLPAYAAFSAAVHMDLVDIVGETEAIAFLYLRSGDEVVCIDRWGTSSVNPRSEIGTRRPLLQSTAGISMFLALPRQEQAALITSFRKKPPRMAGRRPAGYEKVLRRSRQCGYGFNDGDVVAGLPSIAVPIMDGKQFPFAALALRGPNSLISGKHGAFAGYLQTVSQRISRAHGPLILALRQHTQESR